MQKEEILRFLEHVCKRQQTLGIDEAFRFRIYIKKHKELPSKYPERHPNMYTLIENQRES